MSAVEYTRCDGRGCGRVTEARRALDRAVKRLLEMLGEGGVRNG